MDDKLHLFLVTHANAVAKLPPLRAAKRRSDTLRAASLPRTLRTAEVEPSPNSDPLKCLREFLESISDIAESEQPRGS